MSGFAEDCVDWMLTKVTDSGIFSDKVFEVYDPAILQEIAAKLNYPVCGILYEGITSSGNDYDDGLSSHLGVSNIVLAESRFREVRQRVDKGAITAMLDVLRCSIKSEISPTGYPWEFVVEIPWDLGDRGLVYYQKWRTKVVL